MIIIITTTIYNGNPCEEVTAPMTGQDIVYSHSKVWVFSLYTERLHKGSMISKLIKIRPGKTIRLNLATTKTFNAD